MLVMEMFCILTVTMSVVILCYSFARIYSLGNWVKGTWISLFFLTTPCESIIISKTLIKKIKLEKILMVL